MEGSRAGELTQDSEIPAGLFERLCRQLTRKQFILLVLMVTLSSKVVLKFRVQSLFISPLMCSLQLHLQVVSNLVYVGMLFTVRHVGYEVYVSRLLLLSIALMYHHNFISVVISPSDTAHVWSQMMMLIECVIPPFLLQILRRLLFSLSILIQPTLLCLTSSPHCWYRISLKLCYSYNRVGESRESRLTEKVGRGLHY